METLFKTSSFCWPLNFQPIFKRSKGHPYNSFKYKSDLVAGSNFGIEIYHNARSRDLTHLAVALNVHEQLSRAASQFLRHSLNWAKSSMAEMTLSSLERVQLLGRGGYAHVELVRDMDAETYALKCINKSRVVAAGQRRHVKGTDRKAIKLTNTALP